jgi:hypothetical protein
MPKIVCRIIPEVTKVIYNVLKEYMQVRMKYNFLISETLLYKYSSLYAICVPIKSHKGQSHINQT